MADRKTSSDRTLKKRPTVKKAAKASASATSARATVSGPARKDRGAPPKRDASADKMDAVQELAAAMPFNAHKAGEYGKAALEPQAGAIAKPAFPAATGSTLTEIGRSAKVGAGKPSLGFNPGNLPLDRVRVDCLGAAPHDEPGRRRSPTTRTRSRRGCAVPRCSRTSSSARRSPTSITSASRSASSTRAAPPRTATSSATSR